MKQSTNINERANTEGALSPGVSRSIVVVHIMRTYGNSGGENQMAGYFAAAQPDDGVDERFISLFRDDVRDELFAARGVQVPIVDLLRFQRVSGGAWREVITLLPFLWILQWRLALYLYREKVQICVVGGIQSALVVWPMAWYFRRRGMRFVYVHRTTKQNGRGGVARLLYRHYDVMAGNSRSVAKSLASLADENRIVALENGVDIESIQRRAVEDPAPGLPEKPPTLIAVGRLIPSKNQGLLLDALTIVRSTFPDATLWVVGDGPDRIALEERARACSLESAVFFLGQRSDVPALLSQARVFVNASLWEGMSNAVLEAMASGLPSVVVDAPGVTECHEAGETAVVTPRDARVFAEALVGLLADSKRCAAIGAAARLRADSHYSMRASRDRYMSVFARLCSGDL